MKTTRMLRLALVVAAFGLTGATCDKNGAGPQPDAAPAPAVAKAPPAAPEAGAPAATSAEDPLAQVPGLDLSELPAPARKELAAVFSDEFCYCGCPHTLGQCLKSHDACPHAKRMAALAAAEAAAGLPATEIIVLLGQYYRGFGARVDFRPDPKMCQGPKDAKVTLLEFSDFECPFCAAARPLLQAFAKEHPEVRLCFQPFPLRGHPHAFPAAQAVMVAKEHGKFWALHDALFENQHALSKEKIVALAGEVGLSEQVRQALEAGTYLDVLQTQKDEAVAAGVDHTPMVFVNGRAFVLGLSEEALAHTVEDELEWQADGPGWARD